MLIFVDMFDAIFQPDVYGGVLVTMSVLAVMVFIGLHYVKAGYGIMRRGGWGPTLPNRLGWVLMEAPALAAMLLLWWHSDRRADAAPAVMASLFVLHYAQRSLVFPLLMRGRNRMPVVITLMGAVFNVVNAYMLGGWLFYMAPEGHYTSQWLLSPQFIIGTVIFLAGMCINLHSDHIIRHLRRPGDNRHYLPRGGMFRYVSSANYLGELTEWVGYAVLTWSAAGAVFALWTFANLAPRARDISARYAAEFGEEFTRLRLKSIIPFIY